MYSSTIIDMSRIFLPRFVTQIFIAGKNMFLWAIMCVFISLYWFTTDFLLWTTRLLRFLITSYHDMTVTLMYNEIQLQLGQQSILVFQWRLNSEKCLEHSGYLSRQTREMCRTNHDQWCWAALRLCFNSLCYLSETFLEILDILSYFLCMSMFDILTTNCISDQWYENDWSLIKAFY